ncbi:MAG TPA: hypothetical protein PKY77_07285 [Phycisphaerae bacterium]|nr:hypothetical protein [Phycisphaerae bacterium]HRY67805.1 hypothetical protein [Phycisphaerae bacterium]HSA25257.1 hypothetical protein [Phycisphaerae bacterium]
MAQNWTMSDTETSTVGRHFHFRCMRCGSVLEGHSSQSNRHGRCPSCDAVFTVPQVDPRTGLAIQHADPGDDGELPAPVHAYAAAGNKAPRIVRCEDDHLEIECPRCERHSPVHSDSCPGCGLPFTMEAANYSVPTASTEIGSLAAMSGVIALLASLCPGIGLVCGLIALGLGWTALARSKHTTSTGGLVGAILGLISLLLQTLALLASV